MNVGDIVETTTIGKVEIAKLSCATGQVDCPGYAVFELLPNGSRRYDYATRCVDPDDIIPAETEVLKFEVGRRYAVRSLGDWDCIFRFQVTSRTDKTVMIADINGLPKRRRVEIDTYGSQPRERIKPFGTYSLSPTLYADSYEENV